MNSLNHIAIVGGGASGVIMAAHLLRAENSRLRVTLIEKREAFGQGIASLQRRQSRSIERVDVARIYDCTGIVKDVSTGSIAVVRSLTDRGYARPDPLQLGLDVTTDCAVIDAAGNASQRLYAVGPLTRGTFFEIDAIPDIRVQCARLANMLTRDRDR